MPNSVVAAFAALSCAIIAVSNASSLGDFALQKVLRQAAPVFGNYENVQSNTSTWMKAYPDDTLIVHMNLPGTHDADTWNYSQATQDSLLGVTNLAGIVEIPPEYFRCQDRGMVDMLDSGIRVFDLRYAADPTNTSLVFWHSQALVSETATVADVMYGFYKVGSHLSLPPDVLEAKAVLA
jgi:1-phosphatidylinositol phosphodiesterase